MKNKIILILSIFLISCGGGTSGTGGDINHRTIKGTIKDTKNSPLSGVDITAQGHFQNDSSDDEGNFEIIIENEFSNQIIIIFTIENDRIEIPIDLLEDKELVEINCTYDPEKEEIIIEEIYYDDI